MNKYEKLIFIARLSRESKYARVRLSDGFEFACDEYTWDKADDGRDCLVVNIYDNNMKFLFIQGITEDEIISVQEFIPRK